MHFIHDASQVANIFQDSTPNSCMRWHDIVAELLLKPGHSLALHTLSYKRDQHENVAQTEHEPYHHEDFIKREINAEFSFLWKKKIR